MGKSYLRRLFNWILRAKPAFGAICGLATSWILGYLCAANLEDQIRIAGFSLQMLGLGIVATGLSETRKLFGRPSSLSLVISWLRSFPKPGKPQTITLSANAGVLSSLGFDATLRHGLGPDASIEQRVAKLEERISDLQQDLDRAKNELNKRVGEVDQRIVSERRERVQEQNRLRQQLEGFSVGGLVLESVGLIWLLLATIFSSLPNEVAVAMTWLSHLHF